MSTRLRWGAMRARFIVWREVATVSRGRLGGERMARAVADMHFYVMDMLEALRWTR